MSRKNKTLRAFLHQNQNPTIEQAWDAAWKHAQKTFHARSMQSMEEKLAAVQAEVEALRAEVEDYRTNGAAAVRFAPSSAHWSKELRRLFGDDARTGIEVLESRHQQELASAERLAEALEQCITSMLDSGYRTDAVVIRTARSALAAYRQGGE